MPVELAVWLGALVFLNVFFVFGLFLFVTDWHSEHYRNAESREFFSLNCRSTRFSVRYCFSKRVRLEGYGRKVRHPPKGTRELHGTRQGEQVQKQVQKQR